MSNRNLVPALLIYWDANWIMHEETRAVSDSLDDAETALERLRERKQVLVAHSDAKAVLDVARGGT